MNSACQLVAPTARACVAERAVARQDVAARKHKRLHQLGYSLAAVPARKSDAGGLQGGMFFAGLQHLCIEYQPEKRPDLAGLRFQGLDWVAVIVRLHKCPVLLVTAYFDVRGKTAKSNLTRKHQIQNL